MPILPQAFWYKVDGKTKQVYFEEAKIPSLFIFFLNKIVGHMLNSSYFH